MLKKFLSLALMPGEKVKFLVVSVDLIQRSFLAHPHKFCGHNRSCSQQNLNSLIKLINR